ncbi:MAG: aminodeoxychorismate lyase [Lachnospiraceae bacterium]|nr:aminodeoxychorismate lyase [Lachnospiraceae bacterium]
MKLQQFAYSFLGTVIRVVILIVLAFLLFKLGGKAYEFGFRIFTEEAMEEPPGRDVQITVSNRDGIKEVAKMLEDKGLIRDATLFRIQEKVSLYDGDIHPGIFTLNTSMTAEEMFGVLLKTDDEGEEDGDGDDGGSKTEDAN